MNCINLQSIKKIDFTELQWYYQDFEFGVFGMWDELKCASMLSNALFEICFFWGGAIPSLPCPISNCESLIESILIN